MHTSLADDPSNYFTFDVRVCANCKGVAGYQRLQDHNDEITRKKTGQNNPMTPDPADGRHIYLRQMSADEVIARKTPVVMPREEPSLGGSRRVGPAHS